MVNVTSVKINLLKEFGQFTEKRINAIRSFASDDYPAINILPIGTVLFHPEERKHLFLTSNQVSMGLEGVELVPNFGRLEEVATRLFEILMLDASTNVMYDFIGLIPGVNPTTAKSLQMLESRKQALLDDVPGTEGLGLRFFYNSNGIRGDFRIEPYMQDLSKYFLQVQVSPNNNDTSLGEVFYHAQRMFEEFTGKLGHFAIELTK